MTEAADRIRLRARGRLFDGWTGLSWRRILDGAVSSAEVAIPSDALGRLPLEPGDAVEVLVGDDLLLTGWVTGLTAEAKAETRGGTLTVRSRTCDLVDCSAMVTPGQWSASALRIARDIAAPFGIAVAGPADAPPIVFELEQGEGAFAAIDRACRFSALLARDDAAGNLVLYRPSGRPAAVALRHLTGPDGDPEPGNNVAEASYRVDVTPRFSEVTVRGQTGAYALDPAAGFASAATVRDPGVTRYRPKIVQAENAGDSASCARHAAWDLARAAGRAAQVSVTVPGVRQTPGGPLWDVDLSVALRSTLFGIDRRLLVTEVAGRLDPSGGAETTLSLQPPEAWVPEPPPPPAQASGGGGDPWAVLRTYGGADGSGR